MSFNIENQKLFYAALSNIVKIIKTLDINKMNGKNLAFMISCFGKNSLYDDVIIMLRNGIYSKFGQGQANIYDIVECFNTLMTLNILSDEDLQKTGLDKNFEWAE
jgi:hypothetical protein